MGDTTHKRKINKDEDVNPRFWYTKGTEPKLRTIEKTGFHTSYKIIFDIVARKHWGCILTPKKI